jgi:FlaA1/EpsC-like NDP-sugar epimerase
MDSSRVTGISTIDFNRGSVIRLFGATRPGAWRALFDATVLTLAVASALTGAEHAGVSTGWSIWIYLFPLLVVTLLFLRGAYHSRLHRTLKIELCEALGVISLAAIVLTAAVELTGSNAANTSLFVRAWFFGVIFIFIERALLFGLHGSACQRGVIASSTLIVGAGPVGLDIAHLLQQNPRLGLRPIGFIDVQPQNDKKYNGSVPVLGCADDLTNVVIQNDVKHIIFAFGHLRDDELADVMSNCIYLGLEILMVPRVYELLNNRFIPEHLGGIPLINISN